MKRLAINIETAPNKDRLHLLPEPEVALGNLKDPAKIEEKKAEAKRRLVERAALDANFGRVVCVSFSRIHHNATLGTNSYHSWSSLREPGCNADDAERALLNYTWDQLAAFTNYASFNGASFDFPFIVRRSLLLNVPIKRIDCHPYNTMNPFGEHFDVMRALHDSETCENGYAKNLEFYAQTILGMTKPADAAPGKGEIGELYDAGQYEPIKKVCEWNAEMALRLAEVVSRVYC